jgi:hypothetical protein
MSKGNVLHDYLTEAELAKELGRTTKSLQRWRGLGIGPAFSTTGRTIIYHRKAVADWLARGGIGPIKLKTPGKQQQKRAGSEATSATVA